MCNWKQLKNNKIIYKKKRIEYNIKYVCILKLSRYVLFLKLND